MITVEDVLKRSSAIWKTSNDEKLKPGVRPRIR